MKCLLILSLVILSCNNSTSKGENEESDMAITDKRFIGVWKYDASSNKDQSMEGITARLTKVESTNESYYFDYLNNQMMFSKKDDSTLIGIDSKFSLHYNIVSERLILDGDHDMHNEFIKLK